MSKRSNQGRIDYLMARGKTQKSIEWDPWLLEAIESAPAAAPPKKRVRFVLPKGDEKPTMDHTQSVQTPGSGTSCPA